MRPSAVSAAALAVSARAAPTWPSLTLGHSSKNAPPPVSEYFNLVAAKVPAAKAMASAPACDLSKAQMPTGINGLPPPDQGLTVRHVAVGRGTQNYTCDAYDASAAPKAAGAVATLFNVSCIAALHPDILSHVPGIAVLFDLDEVKEVQRLDADLLAESGIHYFLDGSTPFFNLDTPAQAIGRAACAKNSSSDAPNDAAVGQAGEKAVAWLRLTAKDGATGDIKNVYRLDTAGGSPPATCKDMPAEFEVEYAAVYWFWQGKSRSSE